MLEGFEAFDFSEGVANMSVTSNGVTFNKAVTMKLHYPEWVLLLINPTTCEFSPVQKIPQTKRHFLKQRTMVCYLSVGTVGIC